MQGQGQSGGFLPASTGARRAVLLVGLWVLLGGTVRWALDEATFPTDLVGDEIYYSGTATHLAVHGEHYFPPYETRPPGRPPIPGCSRD